MITITARHAKHSQRNATPRGADVDDTGHKPQKRTRIHLSSFMRTVGPRATALLRLSMAVTD